MQSEFSKTPLSLLICVCMSHLVDQPLIDQLPTLVLVNWAVAFCQSRSSHVDLQLVTLRVLEHLFTGLSVTYGVDFCGHLVCRRCLARFKSAHLRGSDAALHRYLTCILHKTANEGDNDTCHRSTSNDTLKSKMRVPAENQVSSALAVRGVCPLFSSFGATQMQEQEVKVPASEVFRSRVDSGREESRRQVHSAGQVAELQQTELGASVVSQRVHAHANRVPSPPSFWSPFVPSSAVACPVAPRARPRALSLSPSRAPHACPITPHAASPVTSPSSTRTISAYSSPDPRSLSPWSDCSIRSTPSLFDTELFDTGLLGGDEL